MLQSRQLAGHCSPQCMWAVETGCQILPQYHDPGWRIVPHLTGVENQILSILHAEHVTHMSGKMSRKVSPDS